MAEYIEREALIDAVESIDWYSVYKGKLTAGAPSTENALYKASSIYVVIDNAPAADVAEVVHGRWEYTPETINVLSQIRCSGCGWWTLDPSVDGVYHYCPNCGAKMDLEE